MIDNLIIALEAAWELDPVRMEDMWELVYCRINVECDDENP